MDGEDNLVNAGNLDNAGNFHNGNNVDSEEEERNELKRQGAASVKRHNLKFDQLSLKLQSINHRRRELSLEDKINRELISENEDAVIEDVNDDESYGERDEEVDVSDNNSLATPPREREIARKARHEAKDLDRRRRNQLGPLYPTWRWITDVWPYVSGIFKIGLYMLIFISIYLLVSFFCDSFYSLV
jgi:hypothetical protein